MYGVTMMIMKRLILNIYGENLYGVNMYGVNKLIMNMFVVNMHVDYVHVCCWHKIYLKIGIFCFF